MKEVHISNIPYAAREQTLTTFLEDVTERGAVCFCELKRDSFNAAHKGFGFVTFVTEAVAERVRSRANSPYQLIFQGRPLRINASKRTVRLNPEHTTIRLEGGSLSMGCLAGDTLHVLWSTCQAVETEFDFRDRKLSVKLDADDTCAYLLEFRFKYISRAHNAKVGGRSSGARFLLLELQDPPHVFRQVRMSETLIIEDLIENLRISDLRKPKRPWVRICDFTPNRSIGQSFAYLVGFPDTAPRSELSKILSNFEDFRLVSDHVRRLELKDGIHYADFSPQDLVPLIERPNISIPFKVMFRLNQLVQQGYLSGLQLSTRFFRLLSQSPEEEALWVLQKLFAPTECENPEQWLERELRKIWDGRVRVPRSSSIQLEDGVIWVYRLMVSPTTICCLGPEAEVSNRVTRQYIDYIDNFVRVCFIEEDGTNLSSQALSSSEDRLGQSDVYKRILRVLRDGIRLLGKHYEFLAFSASQLREQSVWMFASSDNVTAESIRTWMGSFMNIRNVAKCAARMGQCFSSTTKTLPVDWWEVEFIEDVRTTDRKYCFSDGIGKISMPFAKRVAAKCGRSGIVPSAFQIRYGGYKGVVAVNKDIVDKLSLRPSMSKFECEHSDLEVISWTKRLPCFLNRQVITLLSTLGIEDHVFERMQALVLSNLNELVSNSVVALEVLQIASSGATHQTTIEMLKAGLSPTSEPYLLSLLQAFRAFQLLQLRTKSRILVPKGRTMMGCLDETKILHYGNVFVQVSSFPGSRRILDDGLRYDEDGKCIVTGLVVVAKNPCLHPGDVRVLQAVDIPQLHHMVDCVVFPGRGHRPHPNECSGSDLDGDLYFVTWDQLLIPRRSAEPMDYTPAEAALHPHPVSIQDIQEFFVTYMMSDTLGIIANAHVVHADKEPAMARDPKCLALSELFTVAVDFPKTGKPALMDSSLRATTYPDFMEKDDKNSYVSQRVLGKLFRAVLGEARERTLISTRTRREIVNSFDEEMVWQGFESHISDALMFKSWYDSKLMGLMYQYEIKTEAEALSGNILPLSRYYVKRQGDAKDRISLSVRCLQSEARGWFRYGYEGQRDQHLGQNHHALEENEVLAKASAWYHVTYHYNYLHNPEDPNYVYLLSFPWVVHDTLLAIKRRNRH